MNNQEVQSLNSVVNSMNYEAQQLIHVNYQSFLSNLITSAPMIKDDKDNIYKQFINTINKIKLMPFQPNEKEFSTMLKPFLREAQSNQVMRAFLYAENTIPVELVLPLWQQFFTIDNRIVRGMMFKRDFFIHNRDLEKLKSIENTRGLHENSIKEAVENILRMSSSDTNDSIPISDNTIFCLCHEIAEELREGKTVFFDFPLQFLKAHSSLSEEIFHENSNNEVVNKHYYNNKYMPKEIRLKAFENGLAPQEMDLIVDDKEHIKSLVNACIESFYMKESINQHIAWKLITKINNQHGLTDEQQNSLIDAIVGNNKLKEPLKAKIYNVILRDGTNGEAMLKILEDTLYSEVYVNLFLQNQHISNKVADTYINKRIKHLQKNRATPIGLLENNIKFLSIHKLEDETYKKIQDCKNKTIQCATVLSVHTLSDFTPAFQDDTLRNFLDITNEMKEHISSYTDSEIKKSGIEGCSLLLYRSAINGYHYGACDLSDDVQDKFIELLSKYAEKKPSLFRFEFLKNLLVQRKELIDTIKKAEKIFPNSFMNGWLMKVIEHKPDNQQVKSVSSIGNIDFNLNIFWQTSDIGSKEYAEFMNTIKNSEEILSELKKSIGTQIIDYAISHTPIETLNYIEKVKPITKDIMKLQQELIQTKKKEEIER